MRLVSVKTTTLHMTLRELKNTLGECADDDTLDLAILERDMIRENVQMLEYLVKQLTDPDEGLVKLYGDKVLKGVSAKYAQLVWVVSPVPTTVQQAYLEFDAIRFGSNDRRITSVPDGQGGFISIEQALAMVARVPPPERGAEVWVAIRTHRRYRYHQERGSDHRGSRRQDQSLRWHVYPRQSAYHGGARRSRTAPRADP